jgi:hypothetical protein
MLIISVAWVRRNLKFLGLKERKHAWLRVGPACIPPLAQVRVEGGGVTAFQGGIDAASSLILALFGISRALPACTLKRNNTSWKEAFSAQAHHTWPSLCT